MINHIVLQGYMGADPAIRKTPNGTDVLTFKIACQRPDKEKTTDWITCIAWSAAAQTIAEYVRKGDEILIEGRLQTRDWTDKNGQSRKEVEVITEKFHFTRGKKQTAPAEPIDLEGELPF